MLLANVNRYRTQLVKEGETVELQHSQVGYPIKLWNRHLIWMLLIQTITAFAYNGYVPLIPFIQQEFVLTKTQVGYLTSAVFLGSSLIAIPSGVVVDRIGVRKTILIFCSVVTFVLFFFSFATHYYLVLVLLFLLGIGYGGITPVTNRGIMEHFPISNRGTAMGIKQTGVPLGITLAALVLPYIAASYGWKISLLCISIILFGLTITHFRYYHDQQVLIKRSPKYQMMNNLKLIISNKKLVKLSAVIIFFIWIQLSMATYLVIYLVEDIQKSLVFASISLAFLQIGGILGRVGWGYISDHFFDRKRGGVLALIGILSGIMLGILGFLDSRAIEVFILFLALCLGITTQGWNGIFVIMMSEIADREHIGLASGFGLTTVYLGAVIGTPLSGWIIDMTGTFRTMWWVIGLFIFGISIVVYYLKFDNR